MNTARCIGERQQKEYYKNTTADGQSYEGMKVEGDKAIRRGLEITLEVVVGDVLAFVALIAISSKHGVGEKRLLLVRSARLELEKFGATDNLSHLADESRFGLCSIGFVDQQSTNGGDGSSGGDVVDCVARLCAFGGLCRFARLSAFGKLGNLPYVHVHIFVEGDILYINMVDVLTDIAVEIVVGSVGLVFLFHS